MTQKITISLTDDLAERVQHAVAVGRATSVSGFIAEAIESMERQRGLDDLLAELDKKFGPITAADREWADSVTDE